MKLTFARRALTLMLAVGMATGLGAPVFAQADKPATSPPTSPTSPTAPAATPSAAVTPDDLWNAAKKGDEKAVRALMQQLEKDSAGAPEGSPAATLNKSLTLLDSSIDKREKTRADKIAEVDKKLDEKLAAKEEGHEALSEALKLAVERYVISINKDGFKTEPRIADLIKRSEAAAHEAEAKGDWFTANELFWRLHVLLEEEGTYKDDTKRLGQRLSMIRLYTPERFWELRNNERKAAGKSDLPPYNGLGENFHDRLAAVDAGMVKRAVYAASRQHIDRTPLREMMLGGIQAVRTMVTTTDLEKAFDGLKNPTAKEAFAAFLNQWSDKLTDANALILPQTLSDFVDDLVATNRTSVALPDTAVLHEFGNGAMGKLDDYSAIIWPDEVARFNRMTEGEFKGVGIQIQMDEETQMIKVVTPLEGTPAMRAGVKSGDLIKKIDGNSAVGISLNQAVDLITGPENTKVNVTVERATGEKDHDGKEFTQDKDFELVRAVIRQPSVKGWSRKGAKEDDWDWFVDKDHGIGYLRLTQFTDNTTEELRAAVAAMKEQGLKGLIFDLRYNPGGLLTEAVSVANTFIDKGVIVSTEGNGANEPARNATPGESMLGKTPVVVLINQGSASASEIVSGALRFYADKGDINALLLGERSFGKGSVQNVWNLSPTSKMKLTTQYYKLPDGRIIHRKPGASKWGIDPHLTISMLPEQESDALKLRQEADVLPIDADGKIVENGPRPDARKLINEGLDVQLETALVLLQGKALETKDQAAREPASTPQ
jgi:carboxyl-terminal processing protease